MHSCLGKLSLWLGSVMVVCLAVLLLRTWMIPVPPVSAKLPPPHGLDQMALAQHLSEALKIDTISLTDGSLEKPENMLALHRLLETQFPLVHQQLERRVINQYSLLYRWQGQSREPGIALLGHMDVVPVPDPEAWQHPPFSGFIDQDHIWGRGAMDDKVSVLAALEAVEHLLAEGFTPRTDVYLAFGHDEEVGGNQGAAKIAAQLKQDGVQLAFSLDEGLMIVDGLLESVPMPIAMIGLAEKGSITLALTAKSEGGHSSTPPAKTAIGILAEALDRLQKNPMQAKIRPPATQFLDSLAPHLPFVPKLVMANRWLTEPLLLHQFSNNPATNAMIRTSTAPTVFQAGIKPNVLPTTATAMVNFRIVPGDSVDAVIDHVTRQVSDLGIEVRAASEAVEPSSVSSSDTQGYRDIAAAIEARFPHVAIVPNLMIAATDSRHYGEVASDRYRFLPLIVTKENLARFHGTNERIGIDEYANIVAFNIDLLKRRSKPPSTSITN